MSANEVQADDAYEMQNDNTADVAGEVNDSSYTGFQTKSNQSDVPVVKDDANIDQPIESGDQDSDAQLQQDDADAIDKSNIISERTRGAKPSTGEYNEGPDEDQLPSEASSGDAGQSAVAS